MSSAHGPLAAEAAALLDVIATKLEHVLATADPIPDATAASVVPPAEQTAGDDDNAATRDDNAATRDDNTATHDARCTGCPVCVALTYLQDHRELSTQVAQGALVIVSALRQYLGQPNRASTTPPAGAVSVHPIDIS